MSILLHVSPILDLAALTDGATITDGTPVEGTITVTPAGLAGATA